VLGGLEMPSQRGCLQERSQELRCWVEVGESGWRWQGKRAGEHYLMMLADSAVVRVGSTEEVEAALHSIAVAAAAAHSTAAAAALEPPTRPQEAESEALEPQTAQVSL
jgi:hypothetical protein